MTHLVESVEVNRWRAAGASTLSDLVAVEEPMEIQIVFGDAIREQRSLSVTMRTPGHDFELAIGFLFTEKVIQSIDDVVHIAYADEENQTQGNVVRVELARHVKLDWQNVQRNFYTTSSCGVCGKASIEAVQITADSRNDSAWRVRSNVLTSLPDQLRTAQPAFEHTGGIHGVGVFDSNGLLRLIREDVGRHNALDKVIGAMLMNREVPASECVVLFSGRASFELIQKAVVAGFPVMAAVGAPSSLAVSLAQQSGSTLIGFLKRDGFNVYSGHQRITA